MIECVIDYLELLRCPVSREPLSLRGDTLVSADAAQAYPVRNGVCVLLVEGTEVLNPKD